MTRRAMSAFRSRPQEVKVNVAGESEVAGQLSVERPNESLEERVQRLETELEIEREARRETLRGSGTARSALQ